MTPSLPPANWPYDDEDAERDADRVVLAAVGVVLVGVLAAGVGLVGLVWLVSEVMR